MMNDSIIVLGVWTGRRSSLSLPAKPKSDTVGSFKFVHYKNGGGKMYSLFGSFVPQLVQHLQFKRKNCNLITSGYGLFKSICEGSESAVWANDEEFFLNGKTKHGGPPSIITVVPRGYNVAILCAG